MNPYRQLAQAMTTVTQRLKTAADAVGESGVGLRRFATETAATSVFDAAIAVGALVDGRVRPGRQPNSP